MKLNEQKRSQWKKLQKQFLAFLMLKNSWNICSSIIQPQRMHVMIKYFKIKHNKINCTKLAC